MNILTEPLNNISYLDVKNFVKENHPEGVQLDYKELFPDKEKLSQLVAAFANTRGGLIIIGVGENRTNGRPTKADGIDDGRHDEFVAQVLGNISPIPAYEFHKTDEQGGKVFVLIRIFEGSETPYYPHNDSNIWIRTGSIKKFVEIASPEHAELLFKKAERAEIGRSRNLLIAQENYEAFLQQAEAEHQRELIIEKQTYEENKIRHEDGEQMDPFKSKIVKQPIGTEVAMLSVTVQPYYPHGQLIRPLEMEPIIEQSEVRNNHYSFPRRTDRWDSIQEGMIQFIWNRNNGEVHCQQIFANGLIFSSDDVLQSDQTIGKFTHLAWFSSQLYITLRGARNILEKLSYQGGLVGLVHISGIQGVKALPAIRSLFNDERVSIFDEKSWPFEIDTKVISDESALRQFVIDLSRDIHWSFQYKDIQRGITVERFEQDNYFVD